jgi:peptidoglycan/xylan/chitin deacetylase (PgdA/CDA1 family)
LDKVVCFRFDVDTYPCAARGVPNLVALARSYDAKFTFYFNMGRAIHVPSLLFGRKSKPATERAAKLGNMRKLGALGYVHTALFNPCVGSSFPANIVEAHREGHEVGLHGGRNHGEWMSNAHSWSEQKVGDELDWGIARLAEAGIDDVHSFSSPGWQAPECLHAALAHRGFTSVADIHGHGEHEIYRSPHVEQDLYCLPTNILGEPGGVGYIEHLRASTGTRQSMLKKFASDLERTAQPAVLYDHPFYAGIHELDFVDSMLKLVHDAGYVAARLDELPTLLNPE